jgi:hypothetical protein
MIVDLFHRRLDTSTTIGVGSARVPSSRENLHVWRPSPAATHLLMTMT